MNDTIIKITKDTKDSKLKVQYILDSQKKLTRKEISIQMGYDKPSRINDLMKRNGYILVNDQFIKKVEAKECNESDEKVKERTMGGEEVAQGTLIKKSTKASVKIVEDTRHPLALHDKNLQDKLFNMLDKYDTFMEVMNLYEKDGWQIGDTSPIIEVSTGVQITYEEIETIKTSIRIEKEVWNDFKELGEKKYKHISNTKLISQAVFEFINKNK